MEFRKMMRTQMVMAGMGLALLCGGPAKAQEIVNTKFDDGPNVTAMAQPATVATNTVVASGSQKVMATDATESAAMETMTDEEKTEERELWVGSFLIWVGAIGMYFSGPAKRFAQEIRSIREANKIAREA
jgi:hypothetical protein